MPSHLFAARARLLIALATSAACGDNLAPDPSGPGDAGPDPDPVLSHDPTWMVRGGEDEGCFGLASAVADVDGDGRGDLLVGIPRCVGGTVPDQLAIFRGEGSLLAGTDSGIRVPISWANANPPPDNYPMSITPGDIDGDARADLLVSAPAGVVLYQGSEDLRGMFAAPVFRVPGETFGSAFLADLNGDGRDDIAAPVGSRTRIYLADEALTFAETRALDGAPGGVGDVDGDGATDLFVNALDGTVQLYRGCAGSADCDGGLGAEPVWSASGFVAGSDMDLDQDGRGDVILTDFGRLFIHLADPATGLPFDQPTWVVQGDPIFLGLGRSIAEVRGAMGGGSDLLVGSLGRTYLFHVPESTSGQLELEWALPAEDGLTPEWPIDYAYTVTAAGDLDADGYGDFVISGTSIANGMIMLFTGGQLAVGARPYLPPPPACGALSGGLADLTVDPGSVARSLLITHDHFEADACEVLEGCVNAPGDRKLLRFTAAIPNLGSGDAIVPGPDEAPELYQFDECHGHDHLIGFSTYHLIGEDGSDVMGHKQGYALLDIAPYCAESAGPREFYPGQGISAGWADVYIANYPCQWIDITGVPDGRYELRVTVDDTEVIPEGDAFPNTVSLTVEIEGDKAVAVD